ncbi:MAG TPA: proline dehydrogenase family protein [Rectinemataceae bacterium]|nr:proline dehydrogenase family protein [Rectinemataceae bacterium]
MSIRKTVVNLIPGPLIRVFASPYVAGDSLGKALAAADTFHARGLDITLDILGEAETTEDKVEAAVEVYYRALEALKDRPFCTLSIKPGHFGYYVSPDFCKANIEGFAAACQAAGRGLTIDMEDTDLTDWTLELYRELKPRYPILGTVLQARLYRTEKDLASLAGLGAHIRNCIGIYNVPATLAMTRKRDMKENLLKMTRELVAGGHYVAVATHDIEYIRKARAILEELGVPKSRCEFQMLLGVPRDAIQQELADAGYTVRVYLPFAEDWRDSIAYLRRRMIESPSMVFLVLKNIFKRGS